MLEHDLRFIQAKPIAGDPGHKIQDGRLRRYGKHLHQDLNETPKCAGCGRRNNRDLPAAYDRNLLGRANDGRVTANDNSVAMQDFGRAILVGWRSPGRLVRSTRGVRIRRHHSGRPSQRFSIKLRPGQDASIIS